MKNTGVEKQEDGKKPYGGHSATERGSIRNMITVIVATGNGPERAGVPDLNVQSLQAM